MQRIVIFFLTVFFCFVFSNTNAKKTQKPNVVFFLVDDMGWKDLGAFGAKLYETPNIDQLCKEGVRFTNAYTSAPICSPTRASVLAGQHPLKLKMWHAPHYIKKNDCQYLLPKLLNENGYATWHVGKWHLGNPKDKTMPTDVGFDKNIGGWISWDPGSYFWPYKTNEDGSPMGHPRAQVPLRKGGKEGEQLTDRLTREALSLIDNHDPSKPFYLNFWYYSVHNRKEAKPELVEKYRKKIEKMGIDPKFRIHEVGGDSVLVTECNPVYAAMLETVDNSVGKVVQALKEKGLYENTLFVFYSDNGPTTDDVPCAPLMGGKNSTYEAGVRMPACITWSGNFKGKRVSHDRIMIMDIYNTVLEAASVQLPSGFEGDGLSLLPHLKKRKSVPKREFFWYFPDNRRHWGGRSSAAMLGKDGWKFIYFFTGDHPELYNLNKDIAESVDHHERYPKKAQEMELKLAEFLAEQGYAKMKEEITDKK